MNTDILIIGAGTPGLSEAFRQHLAGIAMGNMNKIIAEVTPAFFESRGVPENLSLELLKLQQALEHRIAYLSSSWNERVMEFTQRAQAHFANVNVAA